MKYLNQTVYLLDEKEPRFLNVRLEAGSYTTGFIRLGRKTRAVWKKRDENAWQEFTRVRKVISR